MANIWNWSLLLILPLATPLTSPTLTPPFLLLFLLLCSCHPLKKSAIPCNFSGDEEGKNIFFSVVFSHTVSDTSFGCAEALPGVAVPQGVCPRSRNSVSGSLQLLVNDEIIDTAC